MATFKVNRGNNWIQTITYKERNPDGTPGDPIDITDYDVLLTITVDGEAEEYVDGDGLTVTPTEGQIEINIPWQTTADWESDATFVLQITSPDDVRIDLIPDGKIRVGC